MVIAPVVQSIHMDVAHRAYIGLQRLTRWNYLPDVT